MKYRNNIKSLIRLRQQIIRFKEKEEQSIKSILLWRKKLIKQSKIVAELINLEDCKDCFLDKHKKNTWLILGMLNNKDLYSFLSKIKNFI